jgi:FkbM family methyltransferase
VEANRQDNVKPIHYAVADPGTGAVRITDNSDNYVAGPIYPNDRGSGSIGGAAVEVATVTVDDIATRLSLKHADLLKMNIEGPMRSVA